MREQVCEGVVLALEGASGLLVMPVSSSSWDGGASRAEDASCCDAAGTLKISLQKGHLNFLPAALSGRAIFSLQWGQAICAVMEATFAAGPSW